MLQRAFGPVDVEHAVARAAAGDEDLAERAALKLQTDDIAVVGGKFGDGHLIALGEDFHDRIIDGT